MNKESNMNIKWHSNGMKFKKTIISNAIDETKKKQKTWIRNRNGEHPLGMKLGISARGNH